MSGEIHEALRKRTGSAHMRDDIKDFFKDMGIDGNITEPEKLPPLSGPVTMADGTVIEPRAKRGSVLQEAITIINGERQDVYGSPEDSFRHIADYWNVYLGGEAVGIKIDARDVAMMMTLFKIAREANQGLGLCRKIIRSFKIAREANQHKRDNIVDAAVYLGIYSDMKGGE